MVQTQTWFLMWSVIHVLIISLMLVFLKKKQSSRLWWNLNNEELNIKRFIKDKRWSRYPIDLGLCFAGYTPFVALYDRFWYIFFGQIKASVMSTVKMVHEIDGIFMKLIKIAQQTMTKEQLKTVLDKAESKKNWFFKFYQKNLIIQLWNEI